MSKCSSCKEDLDEYEAFPDDPNPTALGPCILCFLCWTIRYPLLIPKRKVVLTLIPGGKK